MKKAQIFLLILIIFFYNDAKAQQKKLSGKKENCTIFVKQTDKSQFQKINCTNKNKYPIPNYGYDKNHCVVLKRVSIYTGVNNHKIFKNNNGLYCSMDGYADYTSWWYVK